jgi:hypothetical protein
MKKAANNGNNIAMYNLAFIFKDKKDYKKVFELFSRLMTQMEYQCWHIVINMELVLKLIDKKH